MRTVTSKDGTEIAYDRLGDGPPVVLMGGALNDRATCAPIAELLAPRFTTFNYDRRGRGASGDTPPYSVDREVEDLRCMLDEAGGEAFLFANCTGGMLALEAVARGLPVTRLALYEPPYIVDDSHPRLDDAYVRDLDAMITEGRHGDAVEHFLVKAVGFPPEAVAHFRTIPAWPELEALAPSLPYEAAIAGDNSLPAERVAAVTIPTLVMDGTQSPPFQRTAMRELAGLLPDVTYRSLEGQNHRLVPELVAPLLEEFFSA
ncbi:alpha/beta fold hydrolase [Actinomadura opuntiae]|uniref:alpha/beta fold hydrolase n=1 Tax=Actinomadura sp. OS1-43 TaxID=604315 RepID=UPI00255A9F4A|nr:alpha/beta hydrolase [Actinomadura sp. OS1-43]MDL4820250.1 alpha/beta hydrolase [Actinomadura sp. OS1-43]